MTLTSPQIGALAENLVANELMIESGGRLSPFQPVADDDGIDVLIYVSSFGFDTTILPKKQWVQTVPSS